MAKLSENQIDEMLVSYNSLNKGLTDLSLPQLKLLYNREQIGRKRKHMIIRLHQRYSRLKYIIERKKLEEDKKVELQ
jgi:hypothetical protein